MSREPTHINQVIAQSLSLLREQLRLRSVDVALDLSEEDPMVMGNPIQLEQVFMNLLTNARDALTEATKKHILIRSVSESETVQVSFQDTGPGIPPELEQRIFDPFFTTKDVGAGTGLGLSITYGIVKDHEGVIYVENRPGDGATFVLEFPLVNAVHLPEDCGMTAAQVLIVDDDPALLEALPEAIRLRMEDLDVDTSDSAQGALERIAETDYDALVVDIKMPGMDGLELLAEIKKLQPDTPTILITGHGDHELAVEALRGGAQDYVTKPIDRDYFVSSLSRAIECHRLDP